MNTSIAILLIVKLATLEHPTSTQAQQPAPTAMCSTFDQNFGGHSAQHSGREGCVNYVVADGIKTSSHGEHASKVVAHYCLLACELVGKGGHSNGWQIGTLS